MRRLRNRVTRIRTAERTKKGDRVKPLDTQSSTETHMGIADCWRAASRHLSPPPGPPSPRQREESLGICRIARATTSAHPAADRAHPIGVTDLSAARDEAARERHAAEATRTALAKAHVRLDTIPVLEKDNERLRNAAAAERDARTNAQRQAAIAETKAAGLSERLADNQARHTREVASLDTQLQDQKQRNANLEADLSEIRKESRDLTARLAQATGELEALRVQNAGHLNVIKNFTAQGAVTGES